MNLNVFDNIDGLVLREQQNAMPCCEDQSAQRKWIFPGIGGGIGGGNGNGNGGNNGNSGSSGCDMSAFPAQTPLAMAYVPFQSWGEVRSSDKALDSGTLFPALDLPFMEGGSLR